MTIGTVRIVQKIKDVTGSIVACGVYLGEGGAMAWAKIAEILTPYNFLRKVIGFDTFEGFVSVRSKDLTGFGAVTEIGRLIPGTILLLKSKNA